MAVLFLKSWVLLSQAKLLIFAGQFGLFLDYTHYEYISSAVNSLQINPTRRVCSLNIFVRLFSVYWVSTGFKNRQILTYPPFLIVRMAIWNLLPFRILQFHTRIYPNTCFAFHDWKYSISSNRKGLTVDVCVVFLGSRVYEQMFALIYVSYGCSDQIVIS